MSEKYPDHETYRMLYARYLNNRGIDQLIEQITPLKNVSVLDLCCGEGRLSLSALSKGARSVTLVDGETRMIPRTLRRHPDAHTHVMDIEKFLLDRRLSGNTYDRIVCQQAVNYWLRERVVQLLSLALTPNGIFAFNTFNEKPSEKPRVKEYEFEGHSFVEVSWIVGETIHHVQVRDGMESHRTSFEWLSRERLHFMLEGYFHAEEKINGKTSLYRCVKK